MLTVLKDGEYQALGEEELKAFAQEYPEIAKYWESPEEHLPELCLPKESSIQYDCWDQVAKRLLSQLWRLNNARIFHEPALYLKKCFLHKLPIAPTGSYW